MRLVPCNLASEAKISQNGFSSNNLFFSYSALWDPFEPIYTRHNFHYAWIFIILVCTHFFQRDYENKKPSMTTDDLCSENCLGIPVVYFTVFSNLVIYRRTFSPIPVIFEYHWIKFISKLCGFVCCYYLKPEYTFWTK